MKRPVLISSSRRARVAAIELYAARAIGDMTALSRKAAVCGLRPVDLASALSDLSCHVVALMSEGASL